MAYRNKCNRKYCIDDHNTDNDISSDDNNKDDDDDDDDSLFSQMFLFLQKSMAYL